MERCQPDTAHMQVAIRYVYEDVDRSGNVRVYIIPPGRRKVRVRMTIGSPEFWRLYNAAIAGEQLPADLVDADKQPAPEPAPRAKLGSLRALCELYYAAPEFKRLGQMMRYTRKNRLESICQSTIANGTPRGDLPYRAMETRHVLEIRNEWFDDGPWAANNRLKALRQLFSWAVPTHADRNPTRDVKYLKGNNPDGFHTWTVGEVQQFEQRHPIGTKARLAMALLLMTGVRKSDVVRLGRQMVRQAPAGMLPQGPWLHFTETKGEGVAPKDRAIPLLPQLQEIIAATPSGHMTFLVTSFGKPFTANGFGNKFRAWCDEAGLPQCSAHGLRKAGATIAAENGATEHQLMAIYGWESPKQAAVYTKKARRDRLTGGAMHLIVQAQTDGAAGEQAGNKTFPLSARVAGEWEKSGE